MNTKQIIATGFSAFLIASCCTYDPSADGPIKPVQVKEHIELVGFDPGTTHGADGGFKAFLGQYNKQIYRVQEYNKGEKIGDAIGALADMTCDLEGKIDYWAKHPPVGKTSTNGGATKYTGQLGASCSTSCKPYLIQESIKMADDFRRKYGPAPSPTPIGHHHGD